MLDGDVGGEYSIYLTGVVAYGVGVGGKKGLGTVDVIVGFTPIGCTTFIRHAIPLHVMIVIALGAELLACNFFTLSVGIRSEIFALVCVEIWGKGYGRTHDAGVVCE